MTTPFFERVAALQRERQRFVVATVVARRAPVSAHLGDRAIVYEDGRMEGFVGGACAREIVRTQALEAMAAGRARLVSIRPDPQDGQPSAERVVVRMTCASEGAVDVYVEPNLPARTLLVVGATPIAHALARLARAMDFDVVRVVDAGEARDAAHEAAEVGARLVSLDELAGTAGQLEATADAAVVASQGHYDEQALETILKTRLAYVGLVASRTRGETVRAHLNESGLADPVRLRCPAGLDLGVQRPSEVALSILAEIVQRRASTPATADGPPPGAASARSGAPPGTSLGTARLGTKAVDPVCKMEVETVGARHTAQVDGVTYYFCCGGCQARFVKDPSRYLAPTS